MSAQTRVGLLRAGDRLLDCAGRAWLDIERIESARQSGYKIATGVLLRDVHERGDAGDRVSVPLGHGSRLVRVARAS